MPKEGWTITPIDNIGEVELESDIIEHEKTEIFNAVIVAVPYLDSYSIRKTSLK